METRKEETITIKQLETLLSEVEQVEETKKVGEDIECEECKGNGEVVWDYKRWTKEDECPVCDGSGYSSEAKEVPTGRMIADEFAPIKLGDKTFKAGYIQTIVKTMELLEIYGITMRYNNNSPMEGAIFNFNIDIDVLLMPYNK